MNADGPTAPAVPLGIFARVFSRRSADQLAEAIAEAGFTVTQFNRSALGYPTLPDPDRKDSFDFAEVRRRFVERGVDIWALSATYNMIDPDRERREQLTRAAASLISRAPELGVSVVTLCSGTRQATDMWRHHPDNSTPGAWADFRASLDPLLSAAATAGIRLGIEPEPGNVVCDATAARRLLDELGADAPLGIVLDPANLISYTDIPRQGAILSEAFSLLGDAVLGLHAKDVAEGRHTAAGLGLLDYRLIFSLYRRLPHPVPVVAQDLAEADAARVCSFLGEASRLAG